MWMSRSHAGASVLLLALSMLAHATVATAQQAVHTDRQSPSRASRRSCRNAGTIHGQEVRFGKESTFVTFGMLIGEAQRVLGGAQITVIPWYKPEGVVKEIRTTGITFRFEEGKLEEMSFGRQFDFEDMLTPFAEEQFNPPARVQKMIHPRMPLAYFVEAIGAWRIALAKSGFREVGSGPNEKEFCTDRRRWVRDEELRNREACYVVFGPVRKGTTGHPRAMWTFGFGNDGTLQQVLAIDGRFSQDWVFEEDECTNTIKATAWHPMRDFAVARGAAAARQEESVTKVDKPDETGLRVETGNGQPKVFVSRRAVEAALGKRLPNEGWIDPADIYQTSGRSDNPPDSQGRFAVVETVTGCLRTDRGSTEFLVFDGSKAQCQPGYWLVTLPPLSWSAVVHVKRSER